MSNEVYPSTRSSKRGEEAVGTVVHRPTTEEWQSHRERIRQLYLIEDRPLRNVVRIMENEMRFIATEQMYKKRIKAWGFSKNFRRQEMVAVSRELQQRDRMGKQSVIFIRGKKLDVADVSRYLRKSGIVLGDLDDAERTPTPPTVVLKTPELSPRILNEDLLSASPGNYIGLTELECASERGIEPLRDGLSARTESFPTSRSQTTQENYETVQANSRSGNLSRDLARVRTPRPPRIAIREVYEIQPPPHGPQMTGLLRYAFFSTTQMSQQRRRVRNPKETENKAPSQAETFWKMVDLLGWLQLQPEIVIMALLYFVDIPERLRRGAQNWAEFLLCLKLAQNFLDDEVLANQLWKEILCWCAPCENFRDFCFLERSLLADKDFRLMRTNSEFHRQSTLVEASNTSSITAIELMSEKESAHEDLIKNDSVVSAWELYKDEICDLYRLHKLEDVMRIMNEKHGFQASVRGYRGRIARWGWKKRDMKDSAKTETSRNSVQT